MKNRIILSSNKSYNFRASANHEVDLNKLTRNTFVCNIYFDITSRVVLKSVVPNIGLSSNIIYI